MKQPIFSLAYTSVRASQIAPVIELWRKTATGKYPVEVIISVDGNNPECIEAARAIPEATVIVQDEVPFNSTRGWNRAGEAATGKLIICVADDFRPCQGWDEKMFTLRPPGWLDEDWIVHTEDGYVHNLCVLSILTRSRYERFGYIFYPDYPSLFSDTEFTEVAYKEGRVIDAKHILVEHMHPDCNKRPRDHVDNHHASSERWRMGEVLFNHRKNQGFPVDAGPKAQKYVPAAKSTSKSDTAVTSKPFAVYIQANRNDICLLEVCLRLFNEGLRHFFFCIPDEFWGGKPTPQTYISEVLQVAENLKQLNAGVHTKIFAIADYRFDGDTRITVETRVRNDSLSWIRQNGFTQICVVDGDELWPVGSFKIIQDVVTTSNPLAISLPMIPVIGFPGYPVDKAQDRVISYVGHSCLFRDCRTPIGTIYYENRITVYHFTSVRRTLEETIEKHRQSGHYDDPEYDFKWWIDNILPNIKPGFVPKWPDGRVGWHMYKRYSIWNEIRKWKPEELREHIPPSIWPYLALPESMKQERDFLNPVLSPAHEQ